MSKYRAASSPRSGSCFACRRPSAWAANLAPLMYGSSCSKGKGRSPRAMSGTSTERVEELVVSRPCGVVAAHIFPGDGTVAFDREDRRLGDAALAVGPNAPFLDHAAVRVTEQRKWEQQLVDHLAVVLNWVDRNSRQAHALLNKSVPASCIRGQLPVAVGSPIAAVEDEHHRPARQVVGEAPSLALVVG